MTNETIRRVKTAIPAALIFIFLITVGGMPGTTLCAAVIAAVMCWELSKIIYSLSDQDEKLKSLVGTAWLIIFLNMVFPKSILETFMIAFVAMFTYYLVTADRHTHHLQQHFQEFVFTIFSLIYVVLCICFLQFIRGNLYGLQWTLLFFFIIWAGDIGAYFAGRKYGKRKLYPLISPGKTIEGALGNFGASLIIAIIYKLIQFHALSWGAVFMIPLIISFFAQIGDLCESFMKRAYHLKDSGHILPGHGGFLDRFDGVLLSLPFMYFCVKVFSVA